MANEICMICNRSFKTIMGLAKHLYQAHPITSKEYYDRFLSSTNVSICACGKIKKFYNLRVGYTTTCSHKCGGLRAKKNLKADKNKYRLFKNRTAKAVKKIWSERSLEEKLAISEKSVSTRFSKPYSKSAPIKFRKLSNLELEKIGIVHCRMLDLTYSPGEAYLTSHKRIEKNVLIAFGGNHG